METRLDRWKAEFPLRPLTTPDDIRNAMRVRARWVGTHPLHNALSDWPEDECAYFVAVGRLIEEACDRGVRP